MVDVGDIVFFKYRDNKTEAKVIKVTKTRVQLKFKTKTTGEFREIWKKRDTNWQIKDESLIVGHLRSGKTKKKIEVLVAIKEKIEEVS